MMRFGADVGDEWLGAGWLGLGAGDVLPDGMDEIKRLADGWG